MYPHSVYFCEMQHDIEVFRCPWCLRDSLYISYHDLEWGRPSHNDGHLFEMLLLESFQAGLSWYTILAKRRHFRESFAGFDAAKVALMDKADVDRLMQNAGIVRNRLKIEAAISNARLFLDIAAERGSFSDYLWSFTNGKILDHRPRTLSDIPATTPVSDAMSRDMRSRGFKFMGSTVCYANMQSIGMVNDHLADCICRKQT